MQLTSKKPVAAYTRTLSLAVVVFVVNSAGVVHAAPLDLIPVNPDIVSMFVQVDYDATTDAFTASGTALNINVPPISPIVGGTFDITAVIDAAGNASSGTLTVGGTVAGLGFNSGTLLTANLDTSAIGFIESPGGQIFEFLFDVTGGDAASLYGNKVGVILNAQDSDFTGSFEESFSNGEIGFSDTFTQGSATPEPSSAVLALAAMLYLSLASRRLRGGRTSGRKSA